MKKILFVCNDSVLYGSELAMLNIIDNIDQNENKLYVLLPRHGKLEFELQKRNIPYKIIRYYSWAVTKRTFVNFIKFIIKYLINVISLFRIKTFINDNNYDIIHSMNSCVYFGNIVAKKYNIKHIWHFREYNVEYASNALLKKNIKSSDLIIFISNAVYKKFSNIVDNNKYKILYDGINITPYLNAKKCKNKKHYNLLIAGTLNSNKGQIIAIKAVEELISNGIDNITLYIAGEGEDEIVLKKYVKENNLSNNVIFLGYKNDLENFRKKIDIYLMCSLMEGWGYVTVESLLSKNLVIASDVGGTLEIIKNNVNGFLFESANYLDLSNKIRYAINNWDSCIKMIESSYHDSIDKYNIKYTIQELEKIYKNI